MDQGEWWLDESGQSTFADGDVGDANHEMIAFEAALGLPNVDDYDSAIPDVIRDITCCRLDRDEAVALLEFGSNPQAVAYFSKPNPDAREYAVSVMNWIRVKVQGGWRGPLKAYCDLSKLDADSFRRLQNADFWGELEDVAEDELLFINEISTGRDFEMKAKTFLSLSSVDEVWGSVEGLGGVGVRCRCRHRRRL